MGLMKQVAHSSTCTVECAAAGMMIYISIKELIPTALKYDPDDKVVTTCEFEVPVISVSLHVGLVLDGARLSVFFR